MKKHVKVGILYTIGLFVFSYFLWYASAVTHLSIMGVHSESWEDRDYLDYDEAKAKGLKPERNPYALTKVTRVTRLDGLFLDSEDIRDYKGYYYAK